MVATLTKNASGTSWNVGNERSYDVWGGVRSGNATGGPKGRYCANLGHVQDDESGLIYMRARYYEPSTGRFISEDPIGDGRNWYIYGNSSPTSFIDKSGLSAQNTANWFTLAGFVFAMLAVIHSSRVGPDAEALPTTGDAEKDADAKFNKRRAGVNLSTALLGLAILSFTAALSAKSDPAAALSAALLAVASFVGLVRAITTAFDYQLRGMNNTAGGMLWRAKVVVGLTIVYACAVAGALIWAYHTE